MALPVGFDPVTGRFTGIYTPRVQSSHNDTTNYASRFSLDESPSRRDSWWSRLNKTITAIGNWIDDNIERISGWISLVVMLLALICAGIWVFSASDLIHIILRGIGACILGGILVIGLGIGGWIFSLLLKILRYIFWNIYTLLISILIAGTVLVAEYALPTSNSTEVVTQATQTYVCTANRLNIRSAPNTHSAVIGTVLKGETVEIFNTQNGFGCITHNGQTGYVSLKYLKKTQR